MSEILVVNYTEKSIAIFSPEDWGKNNKEKLIEFGGRYNPNLTWEDKKRKGWIFGKKREDEIRNFVTQNSSVSTTSTIVTNEDSFLEKFNKYIENENEVEKIRELLQIIQNRVDDLSK